MAIRAEIGASRGQVARQLFTENLLLPVGGGLCGFAIAVLGVQPLSCVLPWSSTSISRIIRVS